MNPTSVKTASVYVPGHITGLFEICPAPDPIYMGSRGSGFSIAKGIRTTATIQPFTNGHPASRVRVFFGAQEVDAPITRAVVQRVLAAREPNGHPQYDITIQHELDIPIGLGLGASGAGALGTALSLANALELKKRPIELAKIAHVVEVKHRTGLGDVIAQFHGGFEIRRKPGAPGIGEIWVRDDIWTQDVVFLGFGDEIETAKVLRDPQMARKIIQIGHQLLEELTTEFTVERFCQLAQRFARATGLITPQVAALLKRAKRVGVELGSMSMLGNSVFLFVEEGWKVLRQLRNGAKDVLVTQIAKKGRSEWNVCPTYQKSIPVISRSRYAKT